MERSYVEFSKLLEKLILFAGQVVYFIPMLVNGQFVSSLVVEIIKQNYCQQSGSRIVRWTINARYSRLLVHRFASCESTKVLHRSRRRVPSFLNCADATDYTSSIPRDEGGGRDDFSVKPDYRIQVLRDPMISQGDRHPDDSLDTREPRMTSRRGMKHVGFSQHLFEDVPRRRTKFSRRR